MIVKPEEENKSSACPANQKENIFIISGHKDGIIKIWNVSDISKAQCLHTLRGHKNEITNICLLIKNYIISSSVDKTLKIWSLDNGTLIHTLEGHSNSVTG